MIRTLSLCKGGCFLKLSHWITRLERYQAHTHKEKAPELLEEHAELTVKYYNYLESTMQLDKIYKNIFACLGFSPRMCQIAKEMTLAMFLLHDIGKINPNFQVAKLRNKLFKVICNKSSNHASYSALLYMDAMTQYYQPEMFEEDADYIHFFLLLMLMTCAISKHHGGLFDTIQMIENLKTTNEELEHFSELLVDYKYKFDWNDTLSTLNYMETRLRSNTHTPKQSMCLIFYERLLLSMLVSSDYYATSTYMNDQEITNLGRVNDKNLWKEVYANNNLPQAIHKYQQVEHLQSITKLNDLRCELFLDVHQALQLNKAKQIFFLDAPTGSGKTNLSLNIALELLETQDKLFYVFPFNTLGEQTCNTLHTFFKPLPRLSTQIAMVNSITPIAMEENEESVEIDYNEALLDYDFLHYPCTLTSHVRLFNTLFGVSKSNIMPFYQILNSVIILDEIQSYKILLWNEFMLFLEVLADVFGCKIVIMSATLPHLNQFLDDDKNITYLLEDSRRYFTHPLFSNRVKMNYDLLTVPEDKVFYELTKAIQRESQACHTILVEFIKKKTAQSYYNFLVESQEQTTHDICLLTGDDNLHDRHVIIESVKYANTHRDTTKGIILVATQVVEAGVDIDVDCGFKDISILDSEEQFKGRINRSCLKPTCSCYFFDWDYAQSVYRGDFRTQKDLTLQNSKMQTLLKNVDFETYYDLVLAQIIKHKSSSNAAIGLSGFIEQIVKPLNHKQLADYMKLIDESLGKVTLFINRKINTQINGEQMLLDGKIVWEMYKALQLNKEHLTYAKREVKLSQVKALMNYFMYEVYTFDAPYTEKIGDIFYLEDGEKYFRNGKFDSSLLETSYDIL